jgi:hypothetical protein
MLVVEDERPGVVGVEDNCALVVAVVVPKGVADVVVVAVVEIEVAAIVVAIVAPITVVDVDVVVVDAFVVPVVGGLAAVQLATGRLGEQEHGEGLVEQSCGFR